MIFCLSLKPPTVTQGMTHPARESYYSNTVKTAASQALKCLKKACPSFTKKLLLFCFSRSKSLLWPLGNRLNSQKRRQPVIGWDHLKSSSPFLYYKGVKLPLCNLCLFAIVWHIADSMRSPKLLFLSFSLRWLCAISERENIHCSVFGKLSLMISLVLNEPPCAKFEVENAELDRLLKAWDHLNPSYLH